MMAWSKHNYQFDAQGNTRALLDTSTDELTDTYTYDAWGNELEHSGTSNENFTWNGQIGYYRDRDTESYQVRRRPYEPKLGRWKAVDPIAASYLNLYKYVQNMPLIAVDPSGNVIAFINGLANVPVYTSVVDELKMLLKTEVKVFLQAQELFDGVSKWIDEKHKKLVSNCETEPIVIVGHSYGGYAAVKTAEELRNLGWEVDYLVTHDAVPAERAAIASVNEAMKNSKDSVISSLSKLKLPESMKLKLPDMKIPKLSDIADLEKKLKSPLKMPTIPMNVVHSDNFYQDTGQFHLSRGHFGFGADNDINVSEKLGWKPFERFDTFVTWRHHADVPTFSLAIQVRDEKNWFEHILSLPWRK